MIDARHVGNMHAFPASAPFREATLLIPHYSKSTVLWLPGSAAKEQLVIHIECHFSGTDETGLRGASPLSQCCSFVTLISTGFLANAGDSYGETWSSRGTPGRSTTFGGLVCYAVTMDSRKARDAT